MDVIGEYYAAHDTRLQHAKQYLVKTTNINIRQTPKAGQEQIRDKFSLLSQLFIFTSYSYRIIIACHISMLTHLQIIIHAKYID